jgi:hypothetical protein
MKNKLAEILPSNPLPSVPKLKVRIFGVRLGNWCIGLNSDYRGLCYLGVWRFEKSPETYGKDLS